MGFVERFKSFYREPFKPQGTAMDWFLFVGLLLLIMVLWRLILSHINAD